jgi:glutathione peroxidase
MRLASAVCLVACALPALADDSKGTVMSGPLSHTLKSIDGKDVDLATYKGKVVLFVNVASRCGYTSQYEGLQKLFDTYAKDGLVVIGVPANNFGMQEPGTNDEIQKFCTTNYKVTFPMMAKVSVKGDDCTPLYKTLTAKETGIEGDVKWNFEKFLIGRDGKVAGRFKSGVEPMGDELVAAVKAALAKK